jgi:hypothetical protein
MIRTGIGVVTDNNTIATVYCNKMDIETLIQNYTSSQDVYDLVENGDINLLMPDCNSSIFYSEVCYSRTFSGTEEMIDYYYKCDCEMVFIFTPEGWDCVKIGADGSYLLAELYARV